MKRMITVLAIAFMSQAAIAQSTGGEAADAKPSKGQHGFHKKGKHHKAEMMKQLNLSEEQKTKLQAMRSANKEKKEAIRNNSSLTEDQKKEQMKALKDDNKKNVQSILTDEQKAKLKEMKAKMKEEKKERRKMKQDGEVKKAGEETAAPKQ